MAAPKKLDPLADVAARVVADNPRIRDRMTRIIDALLDDMEFVVKLGTVTERTALMKQITPALMRSMQGAEANAGERAQREAYERMQKRLRGEADVADGGAGGA